MKLRCWSVLLLIRMSSTFTTTTTKVIPACYRYTVTSSNLLLFDVVDTTSSTSSCNIPTDLSEKAGIFDDLSDAALSHYQLPVGRQRSCIRSIRSRNLAGFVGQSNGGDIDQEGKGNSGDRDIVISFFDSLNEPTGKITTAAANATTGSSSSNIGSLIVITGETASGKSLFIVRALEIISGKIASSNKLTSYILQSSDTSTTSASATASHDLSSCTGYTTSSNAQDTFVEVEVSLVDPHLSAIEKLLQLRSTPSKSECETAQQVIDNHPRQERFVFRRTLRLVPVSLAVNTTTKYRLKSECTINGKVIPFKHFVFITSPLFAIVDTTTAIVAIMSKSITNGNGSSNLRRTALLDSAICKQKLWKLTQAQQQYKRYRLIRVKYETEIQHQQTLFRLPSRNVNDTNGNNNIELISHYINELDSYTVRVTKFCQSLAFIDVTYSQGSYIPIVRIGNQLSRTTWNDNVNKPSYQGRADAKKTKIQRPHFASKMYDLLLLFRNEFKVIDDQYQTATQIVRTLGSLAMSNSAVAALERTRKLLVTITDEDDVTDSRGSPSPLHKSTERLHDLLNQVDQKLRACVNFIEIDEDMGLLLILDRVRSQFSHISIEVIDDLVNEWKLLSRKHNVSPHLLPQCHENYISERDGTNELQYTLLPRARSDEDIAYQQYWHAYHEVTNERAKVAHDLSRTMTDKYLPMLGFPTSTQFTIDISRSSVTGNETSVSAAKSPLFLVDKTDFLLSQSDDISNSSNKGSFVHDVSSSGERARILFAIECILPGSIGTACRSLTSSIYHDSVEIFDDTDYDSARSTNRVTSTAVDSDMWYNYTSLLPITTIYDEIDAHIGGRAVKAMMQLLIEQSWTSQQQVMTITHNPTIAAAANTHVIIQKIDQLEAFNVGSSYPGLSAHAALLDSNTTTSGNSINKDVHVREQRRQGQAISVCVVRNDPYNKRRLQELVRMVCGSNDDDSTQITVPPSNVEAMTFVKALIRDSSQ